MLGDRPQMRASASDGLKLLIAADPDPGSWPIHHSLIQALGELGIQTIFVATRGKLTEQQRADAALTPSMTLVEPGLDLDLRSADPENVEKAALKLVQLSMDLGVDLVQIDQPALAAQAVFPCPVVALHLG